MKRIVRLGAAIIQAFQHIKRTCQSKGLMKSYAARASARGPWQASLRMRENPKNQPRIAVGSAGLL